MRYLFVVVLMFWVWPVVAEEDWQLVLVNQWQALPEGYEVELTELRNDFYVDERIYPELQAMFDAARQEGIYPLVVSAFRDETEQQGIIDERVNNYMAQGYSWQAALDETLRTVAPPKYSEHETGLAVDINAENGDDQAVYDWLAEHAHAYGFIVRYPADKVAETGIDYEPWHFRYVGVEHATYMYEHDLSLEAYVEMVGDADSDLSE
ncbi:M15 family metallopeptidase [Fundicoccus culcitae]|uniref:M15 family metallopeptidase n=1 Tax=Fundicoccus culcitae TaxID=2969821 RepID=A0ABY5P9Q2_9LACT|nr:M15 family metallopeptidase [Fundicoccus culcitae]UUX35472.1 M15 family metallopeptidase [Fundicoccus culcitae]